MKASDYATQTQNLCQRWSDEDDVFTFAEAYAEVENAELQHVIAAIREAKIERPELWFYDPAGGCLFRTGLELHHEAVYRYEDADSVFDTAAQKIAALESQLAAKDARIAELGQKIKVVPDGPPCPSCGFKITTSVRPPFEYPDE